MGGGERSILRLRGRLFQCLSHLFEVESQIGAYPRRRLELRVRGNSDRPV